MSEARETPYAIERAIAALVAELADIVESIGLRWEIDRQEAAGEVIQSSATPTPETP